MRRKKSTSRLRRNGTVPVPKKYKKQVNAIVANAVQLAVASAKHDAIETFDRERAALRGEGLAWARAMASLIGAAMNMDKQQLLLIKEFMSTIKGSTPFSLEGK